MLQGYWQNLHPAKLYMHMKYLYNFIIPACIGDLRGDLAGPYTIN